MLEIERPKGDRARERLVGRTTGALGGRTGSAKSVARETSGADFASALDEAEAEALEADLENFVEAIRQQGEKLKQHQNRAEFLRYKAMVSRFLKRIISVSMKISKTRRRNTEYISTRIVDEKLFQLGQYLLLEESETLELAARIDEIKGLVYDSVRTIREGRA